MTREKITAAAKAAGRLLRRAAMQTLGGKPVSRRRFYAGMAGLAAGAGVSVPLAKTAGKKMLEAQLRHEITFGFSMHGWAEDAKHFAKVVNAAEMLGQPYHAIGRENFSTPKGKLEEWFLKKKALMDTLQTYYEKMLEAEVSERDALEGVKLHLEQVNYETSNNPDFTAELDFLSFNKKIPIIPIEEYTDEERKHLKELKEGYGIKSAKALAGEKTLSEQVEALEEAARMNALYLKVRNDRIRETIPKVIAILKKHYPHLAQEPELRILYQIGEHHSGVISPRSSAGRREDVSFAPRKASLIPQIEHKLSVNPEARLSKEEQARLVIAYHLHPQLIPFIRRGETETLTGFRKGIAKTSYADFQKLDELTSGNPYDKKVDLIIEYLKRKSLSE